MNVPPPKPNSNVTGGEDTLASLPTDDSTSLSADDWELLRAMFQKEMEENEMKMKATSSLSGPSFSSFVDLTVIIALFILLYSSVLDRVLRKFRIVHPTTIFLVKFILFVTIYMIFRRLYHHQWN